MKNKINYICIFLAIIIVIYVVFDTFIGKPKILPRIDYQIQPPEPVIEKPDLNDSFVKNQVIVSFEDNASSNDINNFFESIVFSEKEELFNKSYVITFDTEFKNRRELNNYCRNLEVNEIVRYCEANNIIKLDDCSKGPC